MAQYEIPDPNDPNRLARLGGKNSQPRPYGVGLYADKHAPLAKMLENTALPPTDKSGGTVSGTPTSGYFPPTIKGV